ncbi:MAG: cell division protein FtsB [Steroidobacteraceae bacterium]
MMKTLALSLLAIVLLLQYRLWVSDNGMREVWRLRQEVATQQQRNAELKDRNRTLTGEVLDLKKGKSAIEERARTDLGMVGSNETFFQVAPATKADDQSGPDQPADTNKLGGGTSTDRPMLTNRALNTLSDTAARAGTDVGSR